MKSIIPVKIQTFTTVRGRIGTVAFTTSMTLQCFMERFVTTSIALLIFENILQQTSSRAELVAIEECLITADDLGEYEVRIFSDSEYALNQCHKFEGINPKTRWINKDGSTIRHQNLIKRIYKRLRNMDVSFKYSVSKTQNSRSNFLTLNLINATQIVATRLRTRQLKMACTCKMISSSLHSNYISYNSKVTCKN